MTKVFDAHGYILLLIYYQSMLFLFIMLCSGSCQHNLLPYWQLMTAIIHHMQRRQWRGRHWSCFSWCCVGNLKIHAPSCSFLPPYCPVSGAGIVFTGPSFSACLKLAAKCWNFPPNVSLCGAYRVIILIARSGVTLLNLYSQLCAYKTWKEKGEIRIQKSPFKISW